MDNIRDESWTNLHETMAAAVEALWAILARLDAGIGTVQINEARKPEPPERYPRPSHVEQNDDDEPGVVVVHHVSDALRLIKGK